MPRQHFTHVTHWVFDLDNTLYGPEARLFDQIEARIAEYVMAEIGVSADEATRLSDHYFHNHGATLSGLMAHHDFDPDPYLAHVHDIDLSALNPDRVLAGAIRALPGKRIVYTNGSRRHAERVVEARGLGGCFDALYGIEDAGYQPKPDAQAFNTVFAKAEIRVEAAAMFEDDPRNLSVPHDLGMRTVLVGGEDDAPHVHHNTDDLPGFLERIA